ncbi:hypothetical protein GOV06_05360 [Candidatus Woesearchaeota archaeon]|nr:hypothetical protein [Candidatus Woesearchaeota archaeon]
MEDNIEIKYSNHPNQHKERSWLGTAAAATLVGLVLAFGGKASAEEAPIIPPRVSRMTADEKFEWFMKEKERREKLGLPSVSEAMQARNLKKFTPEDRKELSDFIEVALAKKFDDKIELEGRFMNYPLGSVSEHTDGEQIYNVRSANGTHLLNITDNGDGSYRVAHYAWQKQQGIERMYLPTITIKPGETYEPEKIKPKETPEVGPEPKPEETTVVEKPKPDHSVLEEIENTPEVKPEPKPEYVPPKPEVVSKPEPITPEPAINVRVVEKPKEEPAKKPYTPYVDPLSKAQDDKKKEERQRRARTPRRTRRRYVDTSYNLEERANEVTTRAGLNSGDREGATYRAELEHTSEDAGNIRAIYERSETKSYVPDEDKPTKSRQNIFVVEHKFKPNQNGREWRWRVGASSLEDISKAPTITVVTPGTPLTETEITNEEDNDENIHGSVEVSAPIAEIHRVNLGLGFPYLSEKSGQDNLTINEGDVWDPTWGWVHFYDDSRTSTDFEFKDKAIILNLEYLLKINGNAELSVFGRAEKGKASTNLRVIVNNNPIAIANPEDVEYFRHMFGLGGRYTTEEATGIAKLYAAQGDGIHTRAKVGAHLGGATRIDGIRLLGLDAGYSESDPSVGVTSVYRPKGVEIDDYNKFIESIIADMMPMDVKSTEEKALFNRARYEELVKDGGIAFHLRATWQMAGERGEEDGNILYTGGIGVGCRGTVLKYERTQDNISRIDSVGLSVHKDRFSSYIDFKDCNDDGERFRLYMIGFGTKF